MSDFIASTPSDEKEYVLFCDESDRHGAFYSNFYGGVRIPASRLLSVEQTLREKKTHLGLTSEIKWQKVGADVVERYEEFLATFFDQMAAGRLHMRVMFTHNTQVAVGLSRDQQDQSYYHLYYQFLKHSFGLASIPTHSAPPRLRIYLDEIGDTREQITKFKGYLLGLADIKTIRHSGGIVLEPNSITEVRSHDHIIMQALDTVLGSITFRLNDKHLEKLPGTRRRGKRTIAKDRLQKFILSQIKRVTGKLHFNIGISTGRSASPDAAWSDPYLHWQFVPKNIQINKAFHKR
ncbi:hypothetical protein CMV30_07735 [Nibricoccus aquaticus]|uniref:DUF3800 domain-containing protein n=1 Tax=Nibricoccus aquaticus TaxID=2576891 RepID=A0A290Q5S3_9BACT|nr:DUF3800 domain-containing protein [Nibricoccus aquaticus]ATC63844.1 hypothetical protein CMV30_07735 [Nibricoccus aquaticus]